MNGKLIKIVMTVVAALFIIITIYLMIGSAGSKEILKSYDAVKPDSTSGFNKSLQFVQSYTYLTKDTSIAKAMGMSDEDAEAMKNGSWNPPGTEPPDGGNNSGGTGIQGTLTETLQQARIDHPTSTQYYMDDKWGQGTINGKLYVWERQGRGNYGFTLGSKSTVDGAGCFLFLTAGYLTNTEGKLYTVNDLINTYGANTINGSYNEFKRLVKNATGSEPPCTIYENTASNKIADNHASDIRQAVSGGKMVLLYANECTSSASSCGYSGGYHDPDQAVAQSNRKLSGVGHHWCLIAGIDGTDYCIICKGGSVVKVSCDYVEKHLMSCCIIG